jgi:photosynthetic reaction center cytochrome c subunit
MLSPIPQHRRNQGDDMRVGSRRTVVGATAVAGCLLGVALIANFHAEAAAQADQAPPAAQNTQDRVVLSDEVFKTVVLLRGIPVDTFFEAMGMFANAMGNDCTFCHASKAYFDKTAFAEPTARLQRARQMITMMNAINKQYFGGRPRVTCFTCHQGSDSPVSDPNIALQYSVPEDNPNVRNLPLDDTLTAAQVFDKYLRALGGTERLAKFTSFTAKGTYEGFDTGRKKVPMELYGKAPAQQTMVVHFFNGDSVRTFDGRSGWVAGPETPLPLLTLSEGNLDRARLEAMVAFPSGIQQAFVDWRVGRASIGDKDLVVVQGLNGGQVVANFYFDEAGLLMRLIRWTQTPVGFVPTQIDFADYREVAGVKIPFKRTVSQTYMQMIVELSDLQPNAQIDSSRFARPAAARRPVA